MELLSLPQGNAERIQAWLSSTPNSLPILPHLSTKNHPLLPSPPPSDATPRKQLTERTNFTVSAKQKGGSRSPSPARKLLRLLEEAEPPLRCYQQGTVELPPPALDLLRTLSRNLWKGVILSCFKDRLVKANPPGYVLIDEDMWYDENTLSPEELQYLWGKARGVYNQAKDCFNEHKDENAWIEVVKTVWRAVTVDLEWDIAKERSMLELNSIQTH
ncbi:hypothetical protein GQ44DRAFT_493373 [Phaeosphaeriaceae sp. PMI808]|nr:hypothetical protein GQ44DRAFT_493373 [Phaeosphaeriaceae sp. PMI808]